MTMSAQYNGWIGLVLLLGLPIPSGCEPCQEDPAILAYNRGIESFERGQIDKSIAQFTEAIQIDPKFEEAWCNRGSARLWKGQYEQALADYDQALQLDPEDTIAISQRFVAASNARLKNKEFPPHEAGRITDLADPSLEPPDNTGKQSAEGESSTPSARRVAARALVLAAVFYRARLESHTENADSERFRRKLLDWLNMIGIASELEQSERTFLETPLGRAEQQTVIDGCWRIEGLSVLAWALTRYELPPYDRSVDPLAAADGVGFLDTNAASDLLRSATLRPSAEIDHFAAHATIVHWRLRSFRLGTRKLDFPAYLRRHPFTKPYWLDGLRFAKGDLAIGEQCVTDVAEDVFENCRSTAVERQIAAYWLQGDNEVYTQVDQSTILSGL
jgi:hypothetical protein